jgi:hypothetical protein
LARRRLQAAAIAHAAVAAKSDQRITYATSTTNFGWRSGRGPCRHLAVPSDPRALPDEQRYDVPASISGCQFSNDQLPEWIAHEHVAAYSYVVLLTT